jgi:hypothetical protein
MLIDRNQWRLHAAPALAAFGVTAALIGWYMAESYRQGEWLGGGSLPGLTLGIVAALIILFEMALSPRKWLRRMRLFPTRYWLAAHLWFGLACLPLAIAHSGFHLGGWFTSMLTMLLVGTVLSGVIGLAMQNVVPKWLLRQVPAETITTQIDHVALTLVDDVDQLLRTVCGPRARASHSSDTNADEVSDDHPESSKPDQGLSSTSHAPSQASAVAEQGLRSAVAEQGSRSAVAEQGSRSAVAEQGSRSAVAEQGSRSAVVIGASRDVRDRRGRYLGEGATKLSDADSKALWNAYAELRPFLVDGSTNLYLFGDQTRSTTWFRLLRSACSPEADELIEPLERLADTRRQFNLQKRLDRWLHAWLPIHIALSAGLTLLLIGHVILALRYW